MEIVVDDIINKEMDKVNIAVQVSQAQDLINHVQDQIIPQVVDMVVLAIRLT